MYNVKRVKDALLNIKPILKHTFNFHKRSGNVNLPTSTPSSKTKTGTQHSDIHAILISSGSHTINFDVFNFAWKRTIHTENRMPKNLIRFPLEQVFFILLTQKFFSLKESCSFLYTHNDASFLIFFRTFGAGRLHSI